VGYNYVIQNNGSAGAALILYGTQYTSCTAACTAEGEPVGPPPPPPPPPTPPPPPPPPSSYTSIGKYTVKTALSCGSAAGSLVFIFLNDTDYATYNGNGGFLEIGMQFYANNSGDAWFNSGNKVYDMNALTIFNLSGGAITSVYSYC